MATRSEATPERTLRRNGQLMSCEPCRRSKQRCDHGRPHCVRCKRRRQESQCYYHPAPMTQRSEALPGPRRVIQQTTPFPLTESSSSTNTTPPTAAASVVDVQQGALDRSTGLLSMHNFLPRLTKSEASKEQPPCAYVSMTRNGVALPSPAFTASPELVTEGTAVLDLVLGSPALLDLMSEIWAEGESETACGGPITIAAWTIVQRDFIPALRAENPLPEMTLLSQAIFQRTSQPLEWPDSAADGALERALSLGGMRWEVLGLFFAHSGMMIASSDDNMTSGLGAWGSDRKGAVQRATEASIQCQRLSERVGQLNDLGLWLSILVAVLSTWCYGDDCYLPWRLLGELTSILTALGYHRAAPEDSSIPFYLKELRKRAFGFVFELDKSQSTFLGRPPRLHRHYCTIDLPLDVSDIVLVSSTEVIESEKAKLDVNGWNQDGKVYSASHSRLSFMFNEIREEVLELSLGPPSHDLASKAQQLLRKSLSTWESIPACMRYEPSFWGVKPPFSVMCLLNYRIVYLYSNFLLQKLVVNQTNRGRETLIETSHTILSLVLSAFEQRFSLSRMRIELEWMTVTYAMPCASVLVLELFRQAEHPQQPSVINRSALIQDLSVLVSCCNWLTAPGQSNYDMCKQAQSIFSRSLDQILNPPATSTVTSRAATGPQPPQATDNADPMPVDGDLNTFSADAEWLAWLDTHNLQVDPWLDFLDEPALVLPDSS